MDYNYVTYKVGFDCVCGKTMSIGNLEEGSDETLYGPIEPDIFVSPGCVGACKNCGRKYRVDIKLVQTVSE